MLKLEQYHYWKYVTTCYRHHHYMDIYTRDSTRKAKLRLFPFMYVCVCVNWEMTSTQFQQWSLWSSSRNISIPWQHSYKTSILLYIALKAFFARGKRDIRHTMHPISTKHSVSHQRNDSL